MMKKTAVLFVLIFTFLITSALTGCGADKTTGADGKEAIADTNSGQKPSGESAGKTSQTGQAGQTTPGNDANTNQSNAAQGSTPKTASGNTVIPETNESAVSDWGVADAPTAANPGNSNISDATPYSQIIVDQEDLFFAIKEVKADAALGYVWKVYIENRTDKNLMFSFEKVAVNDVMCDPFWAEVITAGKKGNCEITWMRDALEERQITDVAKVDFTLNVYNDDDYREAPLMHDPFTVYPLTGAKTSSAAQQQEGASTLSAWQPTESDQILVNNEDCQVVVTGYDPDNIWGYAVHLYLRNKTDRDLIFSVENTSINGIMCEPFWAEIVTAGKSAISAILWDKTALNENDINTKEVKEIELPMRVYSDMDVAALYVEETFTLAP